MACSEDFIEFVCGMLRPLGDVQSRKMMGDYIIYLNGKSVITACDNIAYIKCHHAVDPFLEGSERGCPYEGARECFILDFGNPAIVRKAISALWHHLPEPKSSKYKKRI